MAADVSLLRRPFGFVLAGGLATAVHWSLMWLLLGFAVPPLAATVAGSIAGAAANYGLQRLLAFRDAGPHRQVLLRYLPVCLWAWGSNFLLFLLLADFVGLPVPIAQAGTTLLTTLMNFALYKRMVFL